MKFSYKVKIYLFSLLIILNILLRLFVSDHERMIDSYEMHILANSISEFGEARWWTHPLSIVGMYINSYASMIPFFISGISQIIGIDNEKAAFIYSILFGLLSIFASYILAGTLYDDDLYKFVVSFGFSLSPGVLEYTTWVALARSPFIILLPFMLYGLLKSNQKYLKFRLICIIFSVLLLTTHHLAFYLIPLFASYLIIRIIYYIDVNKYVKYDKLNNLHPLITSSAFLFLYLYAFMNNKFQTANSKWVNLSEMTTEYPRYIGILIFLSIGGFFHLLFKPNKSKGEWTLLYSLVFLAPFLSEMRYTKWFILIFASLLAGMGIVNMVKLNCINKKIISIATVFLVISVSLFGGYFQYLHESDTNVDISDNLYFTSMWIKQFSDGNYISNNRYNGWRIAAMSGKHFLTGSSTSDQANGFVDVKNFELTNCPITSEEFWIVSPYKKISGTVSDAHWENIMKKDIDNRLNVDLMSRFQISWFVDYSLNGEYSASHHGFKFSPYVKSIHTTKTCIYDSGDFTMWPLES